MHMIQDSDSSTERQRHNKATGSMLWERHETMACAVVRFCAVRLHGDTTWRPSSVALKGLRHKMWICSCRATAGQQVF